MIPIGFGEVVRVSTPGTAAVPEEFTWRGRRHRIRSVEDYQMKTGRGRNGSYKRHVYRLRTSSGMHCQLSLDVGRGAWRMDKIFARKGGAG
jgi:hypothetical protein